MPRSRIVVMVVCALVALGVFVLATSVGVTPNGTYSVAGDSAFVRAANLACGETMVAARLGTDTPAMTSGDTPEPSPQAVGSANAVLERLSSRISALPTSATARPLVVAWLNDWSRYAADRLAAADQAAGTPDTTPTAVATGTSSAAASVGAMATSEAAASDRFAVDNGLDNCTISPAGSAVTST